MAGSWRTSLAFKEAHKARLVILTKDIEKKEQGIELVPAWKWLLTDR